MTIRRIRKIALNETQRANLLFHSLPSGCFFDWTGKSAGFTNKRDAEAFRAQFPGWKVN